jgi:hypothetical protein
MADLLLQPLAGEDHLRKKGLVSSENPHQLRTGSLAAQSLLQWFPPPAHKRLDVREPGLNAGSESLDEGPEPGIRRLLR